VVALRLPGTLLVLIALAGCGGGESSPPQLVDGSQAAELPAALDELDDAVLTRTTVKPASDVDRGRLAACGLPKADDTVVIERVGLHGSSLTFAGGGLSLNGCNAIPEPFQEPDRPFGGVWCSVSVGYLDDGMLNDPRLSLCTSKDLDLTGFVWVEPKHGAKWVVVADAGRREVYEIVVGLPVRVTTIDGVQPESSHASFDVEEYAADGSKLRAYVLEAAVAG